MKVVFKTSLIAASLAMAFSANAATITPAPGSEFKLSAEGLSVGEVENASAIAFNVVVTKDHTTGEVITLKFPKPEVSLAGLNGNACGTATAGAYSCGDIVFYTGTGNFTFENVQVNATAGTVTFAVGAGNPLAANSGFRVEIGDAARVAPAPVYPVISGPFSVGFESAHETGSGVVATTHSQFAAHVVKGFSGVIERLARVTFLTPVAGTADKMDFRISDNAAGLKAAATYDDFKVTLGGNYGQSVATVLTYPTSFEMSDGVPANDVVGTLLAGNSAFDFASAAATIAPAAPAATLGTSGTPYSLTYTYPTVGIIDTQNFDITVAVNYSGTTGAKTVKVLDKANAGNWRLDASVVNVPYLPVNLGLTPNVEIANQGASPATITMDAIDNVTGDTIRNVTLVHRNTGAAIVAAGESITTITEADLIKSFSAVTGFDATKARKMSITFIIDANEDDITLSPYYRQNESRVNVMTDQYRK